MPLESTSAERSFTQLLNAAGVASVCFYPNVERDEFITLVKAFTEPSSKTPALADRLEHYFGKDSGAGIRVDEIRFVAEDSSSSEARVAAQLTAKTFGADSERVPEWFRNPEKMIQLIAAAQGAHGDLTGSRDWGSGVEGGTGRPLREVEIYSLLRLLSRFGKAAANHATNPEQLDQGAWQANLASLPQGAQITLRQALASIAAKTPTAKIDENTLLKLTEDLAIRFALDRFQRGEVRVNAVRQMLEKMGHELETLRKLLRAREDKVAAAGLSVESHADVLAPLDPIPDRDVVRHRRYRRIRLARSVPAVITSPPGKYSSAIGVLSLEGGLLSGDIQLAVGTEATLKILSAFADDKHASCGAVRALAPGRL
jgi:hypothetical protein